MDTAPPKETFRADLVLSRGTSVFLNNIVPFLLLTLLIYAPFCVYAAVTLSGDIGGDEALRVYYVISFCTLPAQLLASATVMHGTVAQLRGERATTAQSLKVGLKRLFPVLGVGIVVGLCVMFGFLLLIVPGLILMVKYWVAVPAAVVERTGVSASLKRSGDLVAGEGWSVFAILILLFFLNIGLSQVLQQTWNIETLSLSEFKSYLAVQLGIAVVTTAYAAVINAVTYHDLRVAKEEIRSEEIARAIML
jgi:hypothetical protein